jgi:hypothetical protein
MRKNYHNNRRKTRTGINAGAVPPACTAEHRKTLSDGLRILARVIARAHLRQQAERGAPPRQARRPQAILGIEPPVNRRTADSSAGAPALLSPSPSAAPSPTTPVPREAARIGVSAHTTKLSEM